MGTLPEALNPFPFPAKPLDADKAPTQIRGNDNQLGAAWNAHTSDTTLHTVTTPTSGVTTSAKAILGALTGLVVGWVGGNDGAGKTFVDQVVFNASTNTVVTVSSTTVNGAPASRTYTMAGGILKLQMGSGTYSIVVAPIALS